MGFQELADDNVRFKANRGRVGADERAAKDAAGPLRHVVALEGFEKRHPDLGLVRDAREGNLLLFAPLAQPCAEILRHGCVHRDMDYCST